MSPLWILTAICSCLLQAAAQPPRTSGPSVPRAVAQAEGLADEQERPFTPEATQFVKGMVLLLLPQTYTDDDDWGRQKKIQSGLNVDLDGLKVKTSRRWKDVNHGTWQRVDATLVDPREHFDLKIVILPKQIDNPL